MFVFGHRGAKNEAPENTLVGFRHALDHGIDGVELDIRLSRDEQLVVIHDATVDRTTDGTGRVADHTAAELATLDARAGFDRSEPCGVPTLDEVFDVIGGLPVQVEIKETQPDRQARLVELLVDLLTRRDDATGVIVTSFHASALGMVRRALPDGPPCALISPDSDRAAVDTAVGLGCARLNIFGAPATAEVRAYALAQGLRYGGGPCDSVERYHQLVAWGYGWTTSDVPSLLVGLDG